jgi:hypothetical protein
MSMTRAELFDFQRKTFDSILEMTKKKNADYAGKGDDAFKNFNLVEHFGCVTAEQGFFTRLSDKMARISSFIENGELQVKDESVEDTLKDLSNYSILFLAYLEGKKKANKKSIGKYIDESSDFYKNALKEKIINVDMFNSNHSEFMKFLKNNNAYEAWRNEVNKPPHTTAKIFAIQNVECKSWLEIFVWEKSELGSNYWYDLSNKWSNICSNLALKTHIVGVK